MAEEEKEKKKRKRKVKYRYPAIVPCKRCGAPNTRRGVSKGGIRYQKCIRAICRHGFKIKGEKV